MNQPLYGVWLGDAFFCFSGEMSEPRVDAWSRVIRKLKLEDGTHPFSNASLRLAELRYPVQSAGTRRTERKTLGGRTMEGLALTPGDTFSMLLSLDATLYEKQGLVLGEEMEYWSIAARFALELLLRGRVAPGTAEAPSTGRRRSITTHMVKAVWKPQLTGEDAERFLKLAANIPPLCIGVPKVLEGKDPATREEAGAVVLYSFLCSMIDTEMREAVRGMEVKLSSYLQNYRRGRSPLTELWWNSLLTVSREIPVQGAAEEVQDLTRDVELAGHTALPYIEGEELPPENGNIRLVLRLEPPLDEGQTDWFVSFWAEGREDEGLWLPASSIWRSKDKDLLIRGRMYLAIQKQLLLAIGEAAEQSEELTHGLNGPAPEGVVLPLEKLSSFMKQSVPQLKQIGVTVQMPSRWSREGRRKVGLTLRMKQDAASNGTAEHRLPSLGMDHLVSFEVSAAVGGQHLTREELKALAEANMPYVQFRGEWIEINLKEINQVLRFMMRHEQSEMKLSEWIHLTAEMDEDRMWKGFFIEEVETAGMLSTLLNEEERYRIQERQVPSSLHGQLRPYQVRGYQWLSVMRDLGFGVCLADDMGLGKTVQVITCLLDRRKEEQNAPVLIVCPTSLLGNWQRELQRFAPGLTLYIHHGVQRLRGEAFQKEALQHDIVLTTYHLAGRDGTDLSSIRWSSVVLDEAQYIKNYRTKAAQSVMKLSAPHRIAMTGTPVENRLGELWSIFHFLNPGYLGSFHAFRQRYVLGEDQRERLQELHRLVSPFMLRRLKSDPDIRKDLPEKLEMKSYCTLTEVQGAMYQAVVDEMLEQIGDRKGMERKGLVLSSLTKLKQICNHPQLLRGDDGRTLKAEASGKMQRLLEILDSIADMEESALIFTQYVSMGEMLVKLLTKRYGKKPPFLHGGVTKQERDDMVRVFQEGKGTGFFVLSLKAGGVGLNLTRANHVLHYDRWWNPAVENQATDRVFRIGQAKNVQVHKLISQGTLEERIDELIEQKKALSEQVIGSGETWLTEMSDRELRQLIELQGQDWM